MTRAAILIDIDAIMARRAGQLVIDALREAGLDPLKASRIRMVRELAGSWARREMSREDFVECCRKIAILNPRITVED